MKYCTWKIQNLLVNGKNEECHILYSNDNELIAMVIQYSNWLTAHCVIEPCATRDNNHIIYNDTLSIVEGKALVEKTVAEAGWNVITDPKLLNLL